MRVIHELAHAVGTVKRDGGRAGRRLGSRRDSTGDAARLEYIHSAKTGAFIRVALRSGAILAGANQEDLARITAYGEKIGLAFQIADDLLDVLGSQAELGKTIGKDEQQHKATYPAIHGIEASRQSLPAS